MRRSRDRKRSHDCGLGAEERKAQTSHNLSDIATAADPFVLYQVPHLALVLQCPDVRQARQNETLADKDRGRNIGGVLNEGVIVLPHPCNPELGKLRRGVRLVLMNNPA